MVTLLSLLPVLAPYTIQWKISILSLSMFPRKLVVYWLANSSSDLAVSHVDSMRTSNPSGRGFRGLMYGQSRPRIKLERFPCLKLAQEQWQYKDFPKRGTIIDSFKKLAAEQAPDIAHMIISWAVIRPSIKSKAGLGYQSKRYYLKRILRFGSS